ncbi:MAG: acetyl-CoA carboxylase carboxyltransferase subunit beta [Saprospiraceae bacterium]|jgi:acetyl-CoA carboxylase carboxyl transferase subunit beta|nr:acetyl-CoA carboxylase carboxyltransferase subunit beta [Saprospiraceae bacterium]MCA0333649.1 acetyl-CoA carboxylase, carboxyltransferase subunit beta [Bacteroidota bacterium]MCO5248395.1 acetyl-CoA carboxylase, carboxyltransferase subunit beta [Chitinophagales bacterium]MCB0604638.1 acetyl-CoA carboxylase carboxyltransferase subunit beta [Saprospiraceae bacterium]MCO5277988.1 acetyl-CoA carboxylase, carboxyltransferase subunit beta [Saprospiraceae bacterium]
MSWFKRLKEGIQTTTKNKKEAPDGLWYKCKECKEASTMKEFRENFYKCPKCDYHARIGSKEYFSIILNPGYSILFNNIESEDFLNFVDLKPYKDRLVEAQKKTKLIDALSVATGHVGEFNIPLTIACMDFAFIGGSMGSVVGEKIALAIEYSIKHRTALLIISKSGGARMMESAFSLMQLAKTSAMLTMLSNEGLPYISLMTDPTTGGVTASFAMLGDLNIAEPKALIGFAGPRVIRETIKRDLPEGFQTAESTLENGFLDTIVNRKDLKATLENMLSILGVK